jgi:hypothetical protein
MAMLPGSCRSYFEVHVTSIDRTAYPRFKRMITTRELTGSFTPSDDEMEWARDITLTDEHLLALLKAAREELRHYAYIGDRVDLGDLLRPAPKTEAELKQLGAEAAATTVLGQLILRVREQSTIR